MPTDILTASLTDAETTTSNQIQTTLRREEDVEGRRVVGWSLLVPKSGNQGNSVDVFSYIEPVYPVPPPPSDLVVTDYPDDPSSDSPVESYLSSKSQICIAYSAAVIGANSRRILLSRPANSGTQALSWDNDPQRIPWSQQLLASIATYKPQLELGFPDTFISGYGALNANLQTKFWAELIIAVALFESSWNPHCIFHEPPPLNVDSVGLLQLSYEDQAPYGLEPLDPTKKSLEDPLINLRCGTKIFATLVSRDKSVATSNNGKYRGAAAYWSVLRAGHKIDQIIALTKKNVGM